MPEFDKRIIDLDTQKMLFVSHQISRNRLLQLVKNVTSGSGREEKKIQEEKETQEEKVANAQQYVLKLIEVGKISKDTDDLNFYAH